MSQVHQERTLLTLKLLSNYDLERVEQLINRKLTSFFKREVNLESYHTDVNELDHENFVQNKLNRVLAGSEFDCFLSIESIKRLFLKFPTLTLSNLTYGNLIKVARPVIYLRVVRPGKNEDVGPFHADRWFEELYEVPCDLRPSIKLWLSVRSEPELNGLEFSAVDSRAVHYVREISPNGPKPKIVTNLELNPIRPSIRPGECFVFSDNILHRGSVNLGNSVRCSLEMAFFNVPKDFRQGMLEEFSATDVIL